MTVAALLLATVVAALTAPAPTALYVFQTSPVACKPFINSFKAQISAWLPLITWVIELDFVENGALGTVGGVGI